MAALDINTIGGVLDDRSKNDFLVYANSVIKSRAIPSIEDNLKPIHRRILWSMYDNKYWDDKKTVKSAKAVGNIMGELHPHGDSSIYEALVRLSQWWKVRYPLIYLQGNGGNILGDGPAAMRYTECRLSKVGMLMLEDIEKNCVDVKPNFDETTTEPITLPSKFPFLLCGNNSGIAVGMSSDLVSHNFTEVAGAINYYLDNKDTCSVLDLMKFIKGPDFPTGGQIINGEELYNIYTTGRGSLKMRPHYDVIKKGAKTQIVFHDLPYGVEIDSGIKAPLKKLVIEDGYDVFEDVDVCKVSDRQFDITITLGKNANVAECLNILFAKTKLGNTVKVNQTVIVDGEPKLVNLKQMVQYWVDYRSGIIKRIAQADYDKTSHKLTVVIGLQKCMSDIDLLIDTIRNSNSRADAKIKIMSVFELNDEQADAVLDMKLSKLSKLDLSELTDDENTYRNQIAALQRVLENENERYVIIKKDLNDIKKVLGKDERLTEIVYSRPMEGVCQDDQVQPLVMKEYLVYPDGLVCADDQITMAGSVAVQSNLIGVVHAYSSADIMVYNANGEVSPADKNQSTIIGAFVKDTKKDKVVCVSANGNIKISAASEFRFTKTEKSIKLKEGDQLAFIDMCDDSDFILLYNGNGYALKLAVNELPTAGKLTVGVKSGFTKITAACVVRDSDVVLTATADSKAKFTSVKDFSLDSRGNKGQTVTEGVVYFIKFPSGRENIYVIPRQGKPIVVPRTKISIKNKNAIGASLTTRAINKVV